MSVLVANYNITLDELIEIADIFFSSDGDLLLGCEDIATAMANWLDAGFLTYDDVNRWGVEARCFDPQAAKDLKISGISPDMAEIRVEVEGRWDTLGYWYANGDIKIEDYHDALIVAAGRQNDPKEPWADDDNLFRDLIS